MTTSPLLPFSMRSMKSMTRSHKPLIRTATTLSITSPSLNGARRVHNTLQYTPLIPSMHHPPNRTSTRLNSPPPHPTHTTPPQVTTSSLSVTQSDSNPHHTTRHTLSPPAHSPLRTAKFWTYWMSISHRLCSPLMDRSNPLLLYMSTHPANLTLLL